MPKHFKKIKLKNFPADSKKSGQAGICRCCVHMLHFLCFFIFEFVFYLSGCGSYLGYSSYLVLLFFRICSLTLTNLAILKTLESDLSSVIISVRMQVCSLFTHGPNQGDA